MEPDGEFAGFFSGVIGEDMIGDGSGDVIAGELTGGGSVVESEYSYGELVAVPCFLFKDISIKGSSSGDVGIANALPLVAEVDGEPSGPFEVTGIGGVEGEW